MKVKEVWSSQDPRELIGKRARIIVFTQDKAFSGSVETKHAWAIWLDSDFNAGFISADDEWPKGWFWTFAPVNENLNWNTISKPGHFLTSHPDDNRVMLSWTWSGHWWVYACREDGYPLYEGEMWKKVTDQPFTKLEDAQAWVEENIPPRKKQNENCGCKD